MKDIPTISIDGLSGAGKSSLARAVGKLLGYNVLNSGILYRTMALLCVGKFKGEILTISKLISLVKCAQESVKRFIMATDWSKESSGTFLASERVGLLASRLSTFPAVRQSLLSIQLMFLRRPGLVAEGRDMGTVVFPQSTLKFFVTAPLGERCRRRSGQLVKGEVSLLGVRKVAETIVQRDAIDAELFGRTVPTKNGQCHTINSSKGGLQYQTEKIMNYLWVGEQ